MNRMINTVILTLVLPATLLAQINWTQHPIQFGFGGARSVCAIDLDNDDDMDVLAVANETNYVSWWENDGNQNFTRHDIDNNFGGASAIFVSDLDNANGLDVVGVARATDQVAWWQNDGYQNFTKDSIDYTCPQPRSVHAADMDGDVDVDVVASAYNGNWVAWYENSWGSWIRHGIDSNVDHPWGVYAEDIDGQNGKDVVVAVYYDDYIAWYINDGHPAPTFTKGYVTTGFDGVREVYAEDVDSDGDMDVLGAAWYADEIAWFENTGGGNFSKHTVSNTFLSAQDVFAIDLDNDTDVDILGASHTMNTIAWWENDGNENFTYHPIIQNLDYAISVFAIDMDNDTDVDVVAAGSGAGGLVFWFENDLIGIEEDNGTPATIKEVSLVIPSPFNARTPIVYQLSESDYVELAIYDSRGRFVQTLVKRYENAGSYSLNLDTSDIAAGVYFFHLKAGEFSTTKKCVIMK